MKFEVKQDRIEGDGKPLFALVRAVWGNDPDVPTWAELEAAKKQLAALLNTGPKAAFAEPHTMTGDKPPSAEFLNALRVYRSPDDAEMRLADQFHVIADRIEEDEGLHRNTPKQEIADSRAKRIAGGGLRYIVDGHETADEDSPFMGDGNFPPFVVFDIDEQRNLHGAFPTREAAEIVAAELNRKEGASK